MPLQAQQICSLARQDARCPGFTSQSGQLLNSILSDLCQTYDFDVAKKTYNFTFNAAQVNALGQAYQNLPSDYLRAIDRESFYVISGVPYPMIHCDLSEFDQLVQQAGLANFPVFYATDMSLTGMLNGGTTGIPVAVFWQVPSGAYPVTIRYYSQMADIATPETSSTVPWFPNQRYLRRQLAGELMGLTDDQRMSEFLGSDEDKTPNGAGVILRRFMQMMNDKGDRTNIVKLDRRRFGSSFDRLRNTKTIGW